MYGRGTVFFDGFDSVLRTGGGIAAGGWFEGGDAVAVEPDECQHDSCEQCGHKAVEGIGAPAKGVPCDGEDAHLSDGLEGLVC